MTTKEQLLQELQRAKHNVKAWSNQARRLESQLKQFPKTRGRSTGRKPIDAETLERARKLAESKPLYVVADLVNVSERTLRRYKINAPAVGC